MSKATAGQDQQSVQQSVGSGNIGTTLTHEEER
jgi:hypothetical protein